MRAAMMARRKIARVFRKNPFFRFFVKFLAFVCHFARMPKKSTDCPGATVL